MNEVKIGDKIIAEWPGEGTLLAFDISDIRPDDSGTMCVVFGKDGTIGAEAASDLYADCERPGFWRVARIDGNSMDRAIHIGGHRLWKGTTYHGGGWDGTCLVCGLHARVSRDGRLLDMVEPPRRYIEGR